MSEKKVQVQKDMKDSKDSKETKEPAKNKSEVLTYRGKPLVRKDDIICYGNAKSDKYILMLQVRDSNILVAIQSTDRESTDSIVKYGQKDSLYEAFEIGEIWLESYLKQ